MLPTFEHVSEVPKGLKKPIYVIPVDQWGKPRGKLHKALAVVSETLIKGFETDCIEGWITVGEARLYSNGDMSIVFMVVQAEPDDGIADADWHHACVDLLYLLRDVLQHPYTLVVQLPADDRYAVSSDWAEQLLMEYITIGANEKACDVKLVRHPS